ncbi:helix-turn-helix domain-containing protein, partial [Streptococcus sp. NLN76]|uniref:helix-turn-helix domain-containing protein n=1 Tax=Streptococcus sp. NLN76 TaxID=2822800 RepID=UPI0018AAAA3D
MSEDKKYQVIKQVADGNKNKKRAAVKLGISVRHVNRLLKVYHEKGKAGFVHGNRSKKPKHTIPIEHRTIIVERFLQFSNLKPNIVHFCEILEEEYGFSYSDTTVRHILYKAGHLSPKAHRKTRR